MVPAANRDISPALPRLGPGMFSKISAAISKAAQAGTSSGTSGPATSDVTPIRSTPPVAAPEVVDTSSSSSAAAASAAGEVKSPAGTGKGSSKMTAQAAPAHFDHRARIETPARRPTTMNVPIAELLRLKKLKHAAAAAAAAGKARSEAASSEAARDDTVVKRGPGASTGSRKLLWFGSSPLDSNRPRYSKVVSFSFVKVCDKQADQTARAVRGNVELCLNTD